MTENTNITSIISDAFNDSAQNDFERARANLITVVDTAAEAIATLSKLADQSQNPGAYQVLAKLIDSSVIANKNLLELQEKIRSIKHADSPVNEKAKTINNNLFLSTSDLQKLILESNKKNDDFKI